MSALHQELMRSLDLLPTAGRLHEGVPLDFAEYSLLRDVADAKFYHLLERLQGRRTDICRARLRAAQELRGLHQQCLQTARSLQTSCLALDRAGLAPDDARLACEVLESQLIYMKACLQRSLVRLDGSC